MLKKYSYILIFVLFVLTGNSLAAPQFARPSGTSSSIGWTISGAAEHHLAIDETTANDNADYVISTTVSTLEVDLSSVVDPGTHSDHIIRITTYVDRNGTELTVQLYEGGTPISTSGALVPTRRSWSQLTYIVPTVDAANITDYSNLRLRINYTVTNSYLWVTQAELEVPELVASPPTIISPNVTNITDITATFEADITSDGGAPPISQHGTKWNDTGTPIDQNASTLGSTSAVPFTDPRTGLTAGSLNYFRAYATNGQGTNHTSDVTFRTEPGVQASGVSFSGPGDSFMTIDWIPGSGGIQIGSIVLVKENGAVDGVPIDGTEYISPATVFGTGDLIGSGNYVVHAGPGSSVSITTLNPGSTYYVAVYAYAGSGAGLAGINYRHVSAAATANQLIIGPPALTTVSSSNVTTDSADFHITVFSDGGGTITQHGTMWQVDVPPDNPPGVNDHETFLGTYGGAVPGSFIDSVSSGLPEGSWIHYQGYATNGDGTSYSDVGTLYTEPATQASGITFPTDTSENMTINWAPGISGSGDGTVVVARAGSAVNSTPVDGTVYSGGSVFGNGEDLGGGNFVIFSGPGTSANLTGLAPGTIYHFAVFESKGIGAGSGGINYNVSLGPSNRESQLIVGAPQISGLNATNIDTTTATLGATVDNDGGAGSVDARGTLWNTTGDPVIENQLAEGGTSTGSFSQDRIGEFQGGTRVYYRAYTTNSFGTTYTPSKIFYTEPSAATNLTFSTVRYYTINANWTRGNGDGVIVVVRQGSAVNADPVDGVVYDPNMVIGDASAEIGTGNFVYYVGPGTSAGVLGLSPLTTYHFAVYEYKGSGSGINYQQDLEITSIGSQQTADPPLGHNYANAIQCTQCHGPHNSAFVPRDADQVETCVTQCHNSSGAAASMTIAPTSLHTQGSIDCGGCHEVHNGDGAQAAITTTDTHAGGVTQKNLKLLRGNVSKYAPNAIEPMVYHFDYRVDASHLAFMDTNTPWNGVCQACHWAATTSHHTNHDGDGQDHTHPAEIPDSTGKHCIDCHFHSTGFTPEISEDLSCLDSSCHANTVGSRRAIGGEFSMTSHHVTGTGTDEDCKVCHDQSTHPGGGVKLKHPDTGAIIAMTGPLTRNRNSDALEAETVTIQNDFCFPCHDELGALSSYNSTDGADPTHPFSTGILVPNVYDQFDPANTYQHSVRAASSNPYCVQHGGVTTMLPPWNQDTTHDMITCFDCHEINGHGSSNQVMLRTQIDIASMAAGSYPASLSTQVKDYCTECHDPTVYAVGANVGRSGFPLHAPGQNGHLNSNEMACMGCHAGIYDDPGITGGNGSARGNIHGGSFTWPNGTTPSSTPGSVTEHFLVGGWLNGWQRDVAGDGDCGGCNHGKTNKSYTQPAP